jgi:hypothetical protein
MYQLTRIQKIYRILDLRCCIFVSTFSSLYCRFISLQSIWFDGLWLDESKTISKVVNLVVLTSEYVMHCASAVRV